MAVETGTESGGEHLAALLRGQTDILAAISSGQALDQTLPRILRWLTQCAGMPRALVLLLHDAVHGARAVHAEGFTNVAASHLAAEAPALLASVGASVDDHNADDLPPGWRAACVAAGVGHYVPAYLADDDGRPCGILLAAPDHALAAHDAAWLPHLVACAGRLAEAALRRARDDEALKKVTERLDLELSDTRLLQGMSVRLDGSDDTPTLFAEIVAAAVEIMDSDCASIQMVYRDRGPDPELRLLGSHGFDTAACDFWEWVRLDSSSTCGMALRDGARVHIADLEDCGGVVTGDDLRMYRHLGIRAVQTTPLLARNGDVLGMISTHWRRPHQVSERSFRLFDILVRQAADIVQQSANQRTLARDARQKDVFLAQLAHELRNPLAPLRTVAELLARKPEEPALARYAGEVVARQVSHFSRLVDDLLDVSRITRGRIELQVEDTTLRNVLAPAIEMTQPTLRERRQNLDVSLPDGDIALRADVVRLSQVFANLLINASKYSAAGSPIWLEADTVPHGTAAGSVRIRVRDVGIGFAPQDRDRLFDLFFQAVASPQGTQTGLGVGLALVRRLVELHGGEVAASSDGPGKGSEFEVRLPYVRALAAPPGTRRAAPVPDTDGAAAPARLLRVLVADDNIDAAQSLGEVLRMAGHEAHLAADGHDAVALAESLRPDVLLLDIGMPGLDGHKVCEYIRRQDWSSQARLIALSGHGTAADKQRSAEAGFDMHLTKPTDIGALLAHLGAIGRRV